MVRNLVLAALTFGCGASETFDGSVFRTSNVAFRVGDVPSEWRKVEADRASGALVFRDDSAQASILVAGRCGIVSDDAPLLALTNHLIMGTTDRTYVKEDTVPFDGREARHTVLRAKLDGVEHMYDIYVLKKDTCVYDLVFISPPGRFDAGAGTFEKFVLAFRALPVDGKT